MRTTLTALTVAATMFASSASAYVGDDLQNLRDTGNCYQCNLNRADLSVSNLARANLEGAGLRGADLSGAYLRGANLKDADLRDADLGGANLKDADLGGANLTGVILCNTTMPDGSVIYSGC